MSSNESKAVRILPCTDTSGYLLEAGIFGVNLEITRKGFFGGLCAQMLNNRKLFMGEESVDGWSCDGFERITDRPEESLCQSHFVILTDGSMSQTSEVIALQEGREYEAKAWVKAISDTAAITFGIAGMEKTVSVAADSAPYHELSYIFTGTDLENGTFSLRVAGEAAIFEVSLMPTDHFHGMRWDVIKALRRIAPTALRFPGGCAADHFDWKESLKAPEFRKPADGRSKAWFLFRDTYHQDALDIGLNEFMLLCRELGAEPEFTVSLILSDGEDARRLVEYCNGDATTEYGSKRQSLGLDSFGIHLWYIGNEAYFFGGEYQSSAAAAARTDELIAAMKSADPTIAVAIGLTWGYSYQAWAFDFMARLKSPFDYVSYHDYIGILPDATQGDNGMATCEILESNFADGECFGLNFYRNQLYANSFENIRICVDEWNYSWGKDSSNALFFSNALQFHFLAKSKETYHVDRAEFFMPVNEGMITVQGNICKIESTGELFRLMAGHKNGYVIPCTADSEAVDILCTRHQDHLYLSVVNRSDTPCTLRFEGYGITSGTEIEVKKYSFESNDYEIHTCKSPEVRGHSMAFFTLK
jgi:alpha-N-arabinofuranosidase